MRPVPRQIWLCADDYGISPAVNRAIRELIARRRLNATSVMVAAPHLDDDEAGSLDLVNSGEKRAALGLHVTLTGPFAPLSAGFTPLRDGCFLPLSEMMRAAVTRRLQPELLVIEIATQLRIFLDAFGRPPDFLDGHQHVQLFPGVRDAFIAAVKQAAPKAWVRQCARDQPLLDRLRMPKALFLDLLSTQFRSRAARAEVAFNPSFAGAYDFSQEPDFAALMQRFLRGVSDGGVIMCHPGLVDDVLISLDPLTGQREREYAFLGGEQFPPLLAANKVTLG